MFGLSEADVTLAPMPFFHVGGMWYHLFPSFRRGLYDDCHAAQFDPQGVLELMARYRVTNTHLVPTMIHTLLGARKSRIVRSHGVASDVLCGVVHADGNASGERPQHSPAILRRAMARPRLAW